MINCDLIMQFTYTDSFYVTFIMQIIHYISSRSIALHLLALVACHDVTWYLITLDSIALHHIS